MGRVNNGNTAKNPLSPGGRGIACLPVGRGEGDEAGRSK